MSKYNSTIDGAISVFFHPTNVVMFKDWSHVK